MVDASLANPYFFVVFAGAFFFGETVIITASSIAAREEWSVFVVALAAFLGTISSDTLWFLLGGWLRLKSERIPAVRKRWERAEKTLDRAPIQGHPFLVLLFVKFLYGSRIAMILYFAARGVRTLHFVLFDAAGTIVWLAVIVPLGYGMGKGLVRAFPVLNTVQMMILVLVVSFLIFQVFRLWVTKKLTAK